MVYFYCLIDVTILLILPEYCTRFIYKRNLILIYLAGDCLALGQYFFGEKNYGRAREWLLAALDRVKSPSNEPLQDFPKEIEEPVQLSEIYEFLAYSSYSV